MKHFTDPEFWKCYEHLLPAVQTAADKQFERLKSNHKHPSLNFKRIGKYWAARVNLNTRALAVASGDDFIWFWIGGHQEYDRIVDGQKRR